MAKIVLDNPRKTFRLEVYGKVLPSDTFTSHLYGVENLTLEQAMRKIKRLNCETYQLVEETA